MKCQKVIALLLSTALSVSTCIQLGSITALGTETAITAEADAVQEEAVQSAEEAEEQEEISDSSVAEFTEQVDTEEEAESAEKAAAGDSQEETTGETDAVDTETAESSGTDSTEAETAEAETAETEEAGSAADNEAEANLPAQEAESSDTESSTPVQESEPAAPEEGAVPETDTVKEDSPESSTVITAPVEKDSVNTDAQNYIELSPEDDFSAAIEIKAGDTKNVRIADGEGYVLYRFVPKQTSGYSFYSSNNTFVPDCLLYDSKKQQLGEYGSRDEDGNFRLAHIFTAGKTYYFLVCSSDDDGGTCKVHLEKTDFCCERVGESEITVPYNGEATFQVKAVSSSNIYYQWYNSNDRAIRGATSATYTFTASKSDYYYCNISDEAGNEEDIYFSISIENHLTVYPEGEDEESDEKIIYTAVNTSVDLKVVVSADNKSGLIYTWYMDEEEIEGAAASSYKTEPITEKHIFKCYVEDCYGNFETAEFVVDNLNYGTAQTIKAGDNRQVSVTEEQPFVMFKFTPTQTSAYTLYSSDNTVQSRVEVLNDSYDMLFYNEYGGDDGNFKLTKEFTAGTTYYILAKACYSDEYGSYTIHLKKESKKIQTISASDMTLSCGASKKITVSGAKGELGFYSSEESIADVDEDGLVTAYSPGTTKIYIYAFDTDEYLESDEIAIKITVLEDRIDIKTATVTGISNKTFNGRAQTQSPVVKMGTATLKAGTDYTLSYTNNINAGTATVTISGKGHYKGTITRTFTIGKAAQNFTVKAAVASIGVGKTTKVTASGARETSNYTFKSSNTKVAVVNAAGTVTGKALGTVTITVSTAETANYKAGSKTITITVRKTLKKPGNCRFVKWNNSSYTSCRIGWNKTEGAEGYETLLSWTDGSHASRTIVKSSVLYRDCTVHPQHVSQMMVRAFYMSGGKRVFGPWSNVEYITPSPTKLTTKNASSGSNLKMNINWNIIYGCNGYNVFLATNPNGTWYWNQSTSTKADATSAVITEYRGSRLKKNTRYYVRIVTRRKRNGVFCTVPMPANNTYIGSFIIK